jgi:hypothetical protein
MDNLSKVVSMSLPIIFVIKNGGKITIDDLSEALNGRALEFRSVKSIEKFIDKKLCCLDYDGFNLEYDRFSKRYVKDKPSNKYVKNMLNYFLKDYSGWKLYNVSKN